MKSFETMIERNTFGRLGFCFSFLFFSFSCHFLLQPKVVCVGEYATRKWKFSGAEDEEEERRRVMCDVWWD